MTFDRLLPKYRVVKASRTVGAETQEGWVIQMTRNGRRYAVSVLFETEQQAKEEAMRLNLLIPKRGWKYRRQTQSDSTIS